MDTAIATDNHPEILKLIPSCDVNFEPRSKPWHTFLTYVIKQLNEYSVIKQLIDRGANVNGYGTYGFITVDGIITCKVIMK